MGKWIKSPTFAGMFRYDAMTLLHEHEIDRIKWTRFVEQSATGTWFQTPEAYDFFASQPALFKPFVYACSTSEGVLRGICVGYITFEANAIKQFFSRRAIIIGGPALADDATDEEVAALMHDVKRDLTTRHPFNNRPIYIETRNFNDYNPWKAAFSKAGYDYLPHLNFHVDTGSAEIVESNIGKGRKRDIKTSFRDGAFIIEHPTIEQVREYYSILSHLYRTKVKTPLFPLSFFEALYAHQNGRFLLVGLKGDQDRTHVIGGTVCVEYAGKCLYEWFVCGRDGEWKSIFPSSLATYAGIKYAAEHSIPRFDMMGAGKPEEAYGVRDFKARFGGKQVEYGRMLAVNQKLLYRFGKQVIKCVKRFNMKTILGGGQIVENQQVSKEELEVFLLNHPYGTIFQSFEMMRLYECAPYHHPILLAYRKNGRIKGVLLAVIISNGNSFTKLITARGIIIGGPIVVNNDPVITERLLVEYKRRLPFYVIYSEIRPLFDMAQMSPILQAKGFNRVGHYNLLLNIKQHESDLWDNMHKERRRNVGQAQKNGLIFKELHQEKEIMELIRLIEKTYHRKHVPFSYGELFVQANRELRGAVHYFAAYTQEGVMIAGQIRLCYKKLMYAWFAGSDERYFKLRPNDFLMWNVICWGHQHGYALFDFGGGGQPGVPYGVRDYKLKYGCSMYDFGRYLCKHHPIVYGLGELAYKTYHRLKGK